MPTAEEIFAIAFYGKHSGIFPAIDPDNGPSGISFSRYPASLELHLETTDSGKGLALACTVHAISDEFQINLDDIASRKADHIVMHGRWFPLVRGSLEEMREVLDAVGLESPGNITLHQFLRLRTLSSRYPMILDKTGDSVLAGKMDLSAIPSEQASFSGTLFPYQADGFRWLQFICTEGIGGILADEMGLGKTIQIIALLTSEKEAGKTKPSLIIAPGTILENWRREIGKFSPSLKTLVHQGASRTGFPSEIKSFDTVITSYDTLSRDLSLFRQVDWNIVILDEAQGIKNPGTRRSRSVKQLRRRVSLAVTGTPFENRIQDLWSMMDFVLPGYLGTLPSFEKIFGNDLPGATSLEPLLSPLLLRRRVADVAGDLPARIDIPQVMELDSPGIAGYEKLRKDIALKYGSHSGLVALEKLREYCAHPFLISGKTGDPASVSPKYERLVEIVGEIFENDQKVLVFSTYNKIADMMVADIQQRFGIFTDFIDGRTPIEERQNTIDRFSQISGGAFLVLNPRAAGTGLNVTAANHVIHYNPEWNPAVEDQASARAWRRGQILPVTVHRLWYIGTVEEVINKRLTRKRILASTAVVGHEGKEEDIRDIWTALQISPISGRNGS
jgi:SNF2 family DNA or RNA helicase